MELGVGVARRLNQQDLVAADAEAAVGDRAQLGLVEHDTLVDRVEHDEVVAKAVHLGEFESHVCSIAAPTPLPQLPQSSRPATAR